MKQQGVTYAVIDARCLAHFIRVHLEVEPYPACAETVSCFE
jgi:hypothetical protein